MAIKRPVRKNNEPEVSQQDIDNVINAGSPPARTEEAPRIQKEVKFQMVIPEELCSLIDDARRLSHTSRRAWLLQAAEEKLQREGRL